MSRARNGALALLAATGAGVRAMMKRRSARDGAPATGGEDETGGEGAAPAPADPDPSIYASGAGNPTLVTQSSPGTIAAEQEAHGAGTAAPAGAGEGGSAAARGPGEAPVPAGPDASRPG